MTLNYWLSAILMIVAILGQKYEIAIYFREQKEKNNRGQLK